MKKIKNFIIDSDGVLSDGSFYYTARGKMMKRYGPDDNDTLEIARKYLNIHIVSGDKRGYEITKRRIKDMGHKIDLVSTFKRLDWIDKNYNPAETIYMGDGIYDSLVFAGVAYGIAPANSLDVTKKKADFVTKRRGGEGAVAEAVIHVLERFLKVMIEDEIKGIKKSGAREKDEKEKR